MRTDAAELMRAGEAADDHVVTHGHVAGQRGVVGEHAEVADVAIVGHVRVGQHPVVIADGGDATAAAGATVEGDELAEHVAVADHQFGAFTGVLLVLRLAADRDVADETVVAADPGRAVHAAVRADLGTGTDFDFRADDRERAHADIVGQARRRIDHGSGMDQGGVVAHLGPPARVIRGCRRTAPRRRRRLRRRPWPHSRTRPCCGSRA
ncbi:hypothetical protein D3C73_1092260 [compost metagenome]